MENNQATIARLEQEVNYLKAQIEQTALFQMEKDRLEAEYQRSQHRFRAVFEESVIGKKIINDQLQIVQINKALLKMMEYTEDECWAN